MIKKLILKNWKKHENFTIDFSKGVNIIVGEMGTGKTTLIKALCQTLGVEETISSPTFSLVNHYRSATDSIYHFDFYRIEHPNEVADIGIEEYFESGAYCFLEWADKIKPHLPLAYDHFVIELLPNTQRRISKIEPREH